VEVRRTHSFTTLGSTNKKEIETLGSEKLTALMKFSCILITKFFKQIEVNFHNYDESLRSLILSITCTFYIAPVNHPDPISGMLKRVVCHLVQVG
jgi:hypothetical protein